MKKRDEERGTDDRPQDRKGLAADTEHERFGETELLRHPRPKEGANEPEGDGGNEPA